MIQFNKEKQSCCKRTPYGDTDYVGGITISKENWYSLSSITISEENCAQLPFKSVFNTGNICFSETVGKESSIFRIENCTGEVTVSPLQNPSEVFTVNTYTRQETVYVYDIRPIFDYDLASKLGCEHKVLPHLL